jgi:ABC-type glycerol-3-phosphate transport system substrate-binding protein
MRKTCLILFASALMFSFTACNNAKKTEESAPAAETTVTTETTPPQEEVAPPVVKTPEEALKDFEAYVKEYAEANNNKLKDIQKYQTLAMRSQQEVADMERLKIDFNKKQLARYEKAKKLIEEINKVK